MTTYNEAVCHSGQHKESIYNAYIAPCPDTKRSDMDHTVLAANYTMPAFSFASVHQMAPLLSEVEGT